MSRITVTLSVLSDRLSPDQITSILSFSPDHTVLKGSDRIPSRPVPKMYGWYVSATHSNGSGTDEALSALLMRLGLLYERLPRLRADDPETRIHFQVAVTPYSDNISLYFRAETIDCISKFGGSLDIEFFEG